VRSTLNFYGSGVTQSGSLTPESISSAEAFQFAEPPAHSPALGMECIEYS
jgi:hypothetical protein